VGRTAALLALAGALVAWYELAPRLDGWSLWPSILLISLVLMPAFFALVWIALPLWQQPPLRLVVAAAAFLGASAVLERLDASVLANLGKFAGMTLAGWAFLAAFENVRWAVLVAVLIPWVDIVSVARGPTKEITTNHEEVFGALSIAFVVPAGDAARLGLPDVLFFAVFLGAAARFGLRAGWTWLAMTAGLGLTIILATWWDVSGLPALPAISLGFLLPNADLLWREFRRASPAEGSDASTAA
jgi:hypothetical protein